MCNCYASPFTLSRPPPPLHTHFNRPLHRPPPTPPQSSHMMFSMTEDWCVIRSLCSNNWVKTRRSAWTFSLWSSPWPSGPVWEVSTLTSYLPAHSHLVWEVSQYTHTFTGRSISTLTSCLGGQSVHSHLHWEVSRYTHILSGKSVGTLTSCQSVHSRPVWEVS